MQKLDLCIAECRLCFVEFDEPQEMQSSETISGNNRPSISCKSAAAH